MSFQEQFARINIKIGNISNFTEKLFVYDINDVLKKKKKKKTA